MIESVVLRSTWLKNRNLNMKIFHFVGKSSFSHTLEINSYLAQSIKVFEDFKLMAKMRQEIDKINIMTVVKL